MQITNRFELDGGIVRAGERHEHRGGMYSASMLTNPPKMVWLKERHPDDLIMDAMETLKATIGTGFHRVMERNLADFEVSNMFMKILVKGQEVTGMWDVYSFEHKRIRDYKTTSAWSAVYGSKKDEHESQLNTYAHMGRSVGLVVENLETVNIYLDFDKKKAGDGKYPKSMVEIVPVALWPGAKCKEYLESRIDLFERYRHAPDDKLPFCTDDETWNRGRGPVRCQGYCPCASICTQYNEYKKHSATTGGK